MNLFRKLRSLFLSSQSESLSSRLEAYRTSTTLIRIFYLFLGYLAISNIELWHSFQSLEALDPLWPVAWINTKDPTASAQLILTFAFISLTLGIFFNSFRLIRILVFLGLLESLALIYSFGKVGHGHHLLLLCSFFLIFLPKDWNRILIANRMTRELTILTFATAQGMILLTYTLSGIGKCVGFIYQFAIGETHIFNPQAMSLHIAERLLQTNSTSLLGPWFIEHNWIGWSCLLITLYFQFFAIWALFRPSLQPLWAAALILMHIGISLTMGVHFFLNIFMLGLFLFVSPFAPRYHSMLVVIRNMPILSLIIPVFQYKNDISNSSET